MKRRNHKLPCYSLTMKVWVVGLLLLSHYMFAQDLALLSASFFGGERNEFVRASAAGPDGSLYLAGDSNSHEGRWNSPYTVGKSFVARFSKDRELLWLKFFPFQTLTYLHVDRDGKVIFIADGLTSTFAPSASAAFPEAERVTPVIIGLDSSGNQLWATYTSPRELGALRRIAAAAVSESGRVAICGQTLANSVWPSLPDSLIQLSPVEGRDRSYCSIFSRDGSKLEWASAISTIEASVSSVVFEGEDRLIVAGGTRDWSFPKPPSGPRHGDPTETFFYLNEEAEAWYPVGGPEWGGLQGVSASPQGLHWQNADGRVFLSRDFGKTYTESPGFSSKAQRHPTDPQILCTAVGQLYCSKDGGMTWTIDLFGSVSSLSADPAERGTFYTIENQSARKVAFGLDRIPWNPPPRPLLSIHATGKPGSRVLLLSSSNRLWRSTDGGQSFSEVDGEQGHLKFFSAVLPASNGPAVIYSLRSVFPLDGRYLQRSRDGGLTWERIGPPRSFFGSADFPEDLAVSPLDDRKVALWGRNGAWLSRDGGETWALLHKNLPNREITEMAFSPDGTLYAAAAAIPSGFLVRIDTAARQITPLHLAGTAGGLTWDHVEPQQGGGYWLVGRTLGGTLPFPVNRSLPKLTEKTETVVALLNEQGEVQAAFTFAGFVGTGIASSPKGILLRVTSAPPEWQALLPMVNPPSEGSRSMIIEVSQDGNLRGGWVGVPGLSSGLPVVHEDGRIHLIGQTSSPLFAPTPNAFQRQSGGMTDIAILEYGPFSN